MYTFQVTNKKIDEYLKNNRAENQPFFRLKQHNLEGETVSNSGQHVIPGHRNGLFHALSDGFNCHYPVTLSPDAVWLCILNGIAHHIDQNPEGLRHHFVRHEGQEEIEVKLISPPMPHVPDKVWVEGVNGFSKEIDSRLIDSSWVVNDFSTTSYTGRVASKIILMGAIKHYFRYRTVLCCGLTKVTILGTPTDWEKIIQRLTLVSNYDLAWWTDHLIPIITEFKKSCEGNPDIDFWNRMFVKHGIGSGSQFDLGGWLCTLFPYLMDKDGMIRNPNIDWSNSSVTIDPDLIPSGLACAPVTLNDHGELYRMKFYGGIVGCTRGSSLNTLDDEEAEFNLTPVPGWTIQNLGRV